MKIIFYAQVKVDFKNISIERVSLSFFLIKIGCFIKSRRCSLSLLRSFKTLSIYKIDSLIRLG